MVAGAIWSCTQYNKLIFMLNLHKVQLADHYAGSDTNCKSC